MRSLRLLSKKGIVSFCVAQSSLPCSIKLEADYDPYDYEMMLDQVDNVRCERHAINAIQTWRNELNEKALCLLTTSMASRHVVLTSSFISICVPVIAHYLSLMNKNNSYSFGYCVRNLACLQVQSELLWKTVGDTFEREKMEQYIPISILNDLFINLAQWNAPPPRLIQRIFPELMKFSARLSEEEVQILQQVLTEKEAPLALILQANSQASIDV